MIESMAALHISEAELARDLHAVLEQVRLGGEVVVERDHRPVAVMKPADERPRTFPELIALAAVSRVAKFCPGVYSACALISS